MLRFDLPGKLVVFAGLSFLKLYVLIYILGEWWSKFPEVNDFMDVFRDWGMRMEIHVWIR